MTHSWEEVAASLELLLAGPTQEQQALASALGVNLADDLPAYVAVAILDERVAPALMRTRSHREPNFDDLERIESALDIGPAPVRKETSAELVSAWIGSRYIELMTLEKRLRGFVRSAHKRVTS